MPSSAHPPPTLAHRTSRPRPVPSPIAPHALARCPRPSRLVSLPITSCLARPLGPVCYMGLTRVRLAPPAAGPSSLLFLFRRIIGVDRCFGDDRGDPSAPDQPQSRNPPR